MLLWVSVMHTFEIYDPDTKETYIYPASNVEFAALRYAQDYNIRYGLIDKEKQIIINGHVHYIYACYTTKYRVSSDKLSDTMDLEGGWI